MIRILHVVGSLKRGGTEAFIMNLYRHIDRSRVQFDFLVLNKEEYPYLEEIKDLGGKVYFVEIPFIKKTLFPFIKQCITLMKLSNCQVVHSHLNIMNAWIMYAAKCARVTKRISHSHDTFGKGGNWFQKIFHTVESIMIKLFSNEFLACSLEAGVYLYGKRFFSHYGQVIRNGINVEEFLAIKNPPSDIKIEDTSAIVIGNISRFEPKKNQLFLIDVFAEILKREERAVLLLGGVDGGQLKDCKKKVELLELQNHVRFIGERYDMPNVLNLVDIYIFPSLYEGLGIVLLEAQAAGCYCVASTNCPNDSDMELGLVDYISLEKNAAYWAEEILSKYKNVSNCKTAEEIRQAFSRKLYDVKNLAEQMLSIYIGSF